MNNNDVKNKRKGFIIPLIAVFLALMTVSAAVLLPIMAISSHFRHQGDPLNQVFGEGMEYAYLSNLADPSPELSSVDVVLDRLGPANKAKLDSLTGRTAVQKVLDRSRAEGVNPALVLAIWGKESGFEKINDHAFGAITGNVGADFDSQLNAAINTIKKALNNEAPYNDREEGESLFAMWLRHYTPPEDPRNAGDYARCISFLEQLVPSQIVWNTLPQGTGSIIKIAQTYLNKGIKYSQGGEYGHCGPSTPGPQGVPSLDCSGFVSRIYREAGLVPANTCWATIGIANSQYLSRIANDVEVAKLKAIPGDILLWGDKNADGSYKYSTKTDNHAAIYGGIDAQGRDIIYESGGAQPGNGAHISYNRAWSRHDGPLYGLYRIKGGSPNEN